MAESARQRHAIIASLAIAIAERMMIGRWHWDCWLRQLPGMVVMLQQKFDDLSRKVDVIFPITASTTLFAGLS